MPSPSVEDYIKAIYKAHAQNGSVATQELAERLHVSAPAVSKMMRKLSALKLITHAPYQGVKLTRAETTPGNHSPRRTGRRLPKWYSGGPTPSDGCPRIDRALPSPAFGAREHAMENDVRFETGESLRRTGHATANPGRGRAA